jgi:acetate kinase
VADAHRIRRYGFHGTSHAFVSRRAADFLGIPLEQSRVITLHLRNGASACAVAGGRSIDTSMGLTPLAGLVMGTRCGDVDPGLLLHLLRAGLTSDELDALLNKQSGMKGLSGHNDLRQVHAAADAGDATARTALQVYAHAVRHYLGAYLVELGGADAVAFTAGVGENDAAVRAAVCDRLRDVGIELDPARNEQTRGPDEVVDIALPGSRVRVLVVPTDEELEIATQTLAAVRG